MTFVEASASMKLSIFWRKSIIRYTDKKVIWQSAKSLKNSLKKYLVSMFISYSDKIAQRFYIMAYTPYTADSFGLKLPVLI